MKNSFNLAFLVISLICISGITSFTSFASNIQSPDLSVLPKEACIDDECLKKFRQLKSFAKHGSAEAQIVVAIAYLTGNGLEKKPELALRNLKKAHKNGSSRAAWMLAYLYENGIGTEQDNALAKEYFQYALDKGFAPALFEQAVKLLDFNQSASDANNQQAVNLLIKAEEVESRKAKYLLAKMYELGEGVDQDMLAAAKRYKALERLDYQDSHQRLTSLMAKAQQEKALSEQLHPYSPETELITVTGEKWNLHNTLDRLVVLLDSSGLYDGKSIGHIRGKGCANSSSSCSMVTDEEKDRFLGKFVR